MKRIKFFKGKASALTTPLMSVFAAFVIIFALITGFAFIITKIDATDFMLSVMSTVALCTGAYAGGYISGKRRRKNGLLMGILCGVFIFLTIVILSAIFSKAVESFSVPVKLILTLVCAGIGGVVGVNSKEGR